MHSTGGNLRRNQPLEGSPWSRAFALLFREEEGVIQRGWEFDGTLDKDQEESVRQTEGPVIVTAGPGSGKTRVITSRAAYLMSKGISPHKMFVVTFTKAAAEEMKHRISNLVGKESAGSMHIQTIHSLAYKWIAHTKGSILMQEERKARLRVERILVSVGSKKELAETFLQERTNCLNRMMSMEEYVPSTMSAPEFQQVSSLYAEEQSLEGFLDFDDLLVMMYHALQESAEKSGRYIMVDEFQDTSVLQFGILKLLAKPTNHLFVVGDEDQSIYSWRGACQALQLFREQFPKAPSIFLNTNYRSTKKIVEVSSFMIAHNQERMKKELRAQENAKVGDTPSFLCGINEQDEARGVAERLKKLHGDGYPYEEMAVIYRTNRQSFLIATELSRLGIPLKVLGGDPRVLDHRVSRILLSYLALAVNQNNKEAFAYVVNRPFRYISKEVVQDILRRKEPPFDRLKAITLVPKQREAMAILHKQLQKMKKMSAKEALQYVRKQVGIDAFLKSEATLINDEPLEITSILSQLPHKEESPASFLERVPKLKGVNQELRGVTLTSCHSAKGLEFKVVAVIGLVEGLLPHKRASEKEHLEEERRLAYVALTRAKEHLLLSSVQKLQDKNVEPSPFLIELKQAVKEEICVGSMVTHPAWGLCSVEAIEKNKVLLRTKDGTTKKLARKWLGESFRISQGTAQSKNR